MTLAATVLVPTHDHGPTLLRSVRERARANRRGAGGVRRRRRRAPDATRELMEELVALGPARAASSTIRKGLATASCTGTPRCTSAGRDRLLPLRRRPLAPRSRRGDAVAPRRERLRARAAAVGSTARAGSSISASTSRSSTTASSCSPARTAFLSPAERTHSSSIDACRTAGGLRRPTRSPICTCGSRSFSVPGCRATSGKRPTVLHLPSPAREDWSDEQRLASSTAGRSGSPMPPSLMSWPSSWSTSSHGERGIGGAPPQHRASRGRSGAVVEANSDRARLIDRLHAVDEERLHDEQSLRGPARKARAGADRALLVRHLAPAGTNRQPPRIREGTQIGCEGSSSRRRSCRD